MLYFIGIGKLLLLYFELFFQYVIDIKKPPFN